MTNPANTPENLTQNTTKRTVIIGGVAAGMSAATRLRRLDEHREIIVLERGEYVSFANCGLPYHVGGVIEDREELILQTPQSLQARFALDVRTGHEVVAIVPAERKTTVRQASGEQYELSYTDLVIATGAAVIRPNLPGTERAHGLRDVADLDRIIAEIDRTKPRTAAIVGGGFIGVELAENLVHRGLSVTLVELAQHILPPFDVEMAAPMSDRLVEHGIRIITGTAATGAGPDTLELDSGVTVAADLLVMAVGVNPESKLAREAGLELGVRGAVIVDHAQRTSDSNIYAVGDVAAKQDAINSEPSFVPLAQTANRHGRLVADAIVGREVRSRGVQGTSIVGAFGLSAAATGWTERRAKAAGYDVRIIHIHPAHHAGYYPGARRMSLKLVIDAVTDQILGAQGVGEEGVDKRIDVIATAMRGGLTASDLADLELAYAPQFGSAKDPVNMLGMIADNLAAGLTRTLQWHELADAFSESATLIDVRSAGENAAGAIPGAVHVPLDDLRARHSELGPGPIVVHCAVGQRGHTAARILAQLGHEDVRNLDGGYLTWATANAAVPTPVLA